MSLADFLDWLGRPGNAVRNIATGNVEGAARNIGNFALDPLDVFLPGDAINLVREQDDVSGKDLLDTYGLTTKGQSGIGSTLAGIGVELATDPLTYLGAGVIGKGASLATKGISDTAKAVLPAEHYASAAQGMSKAGDWAADTFNWHRMTPEQQAKIEGAAAVSGQSMAAQDPVLRKMFAGTTKEDHQAAADILQNIDRSQQGTVKMLSPRVEGWGTVQEQVQRLEPVIRARLAALPAGAEPNRVRALVTQAVEHGGTQWDEGIKGNVFMRPELYETPQGYKTVGQIQDELKALGGANINATTADAQAFAQAQGWNQRTDLVPHAYTQRDFGDLGAAVQGAGKPSAVQARTLKTDQEFIDHLNATDLAGKPEQAAVAAERQKSLVTDLPQLMAQRASQQGRMLQKAQMMQDVVPGSVLAQKGDLAKVKKTLEDWVQKSTDPAERDFARQAMVVMDGLPERGFKQGLLAEVNAHFKKAATMGVGVIKPAFLMRNRFSDAFMQAGGSGKPLQEVLFDPGFLRSVNPGNFLRDMGSAFGEYGAQVMGKKMPGLGDDVAKSLDNVEQAFAASNGRRDEMLRILQAQDPITADAVRGGIIGGDPTHKDELLKVLAPGGKEENLFSRLWNAPAKANAVLEERMRLGAYKALRQSMPHEQALTEVNKRMLNYRQISEGNRLLRDVIPFAAFQTGILPQIAKSPLMLSAASATMGTPDQQDPLYPWMEGKVNLPLGLDEKGNPQYAVSLGLPFESLDMIPTKASDVWPTFFSMANPAIKTLGATFTGEDPYFRTPYGSYDKLPKTLQAMGLGEENGSGGALGDYINRIRGTGATLPFESFVGFGHMETWLDPRLSATDAALKTATGVRPVSVDPDLAERQQIEGWLKDHPREVKSYQQYYTTEPNAEIDRMLADFRAAKDRLKEKRKAEQMAGLATP
jgi:hypothetical protein